MKRWLVLGGFAALLYASAPAWPDDWDGVGFVESVRDFDLARFHPHPPGYPVYVALLRAAALLMRDPMRACALVAALSGAAAVAFAWLAARRLAGERSAWAVAALVGATPLVWHACSGVGSEAPALACAAACAWACIAPPRRAWVALGVAVGLGLGVRLSWAPLYLAALVLAPRAMRARAAGVAALACAMWAAPLVAIVGAGRLVELLTTHFAGHAERWGGTVVTEPGAVRLAWLARDVLVDGLGAGSDVVGIVVAIAIAVASASAMAAWKRAGWRGWRPALVLVAPYLLWIALGQNLRDQPRHALPLVALLAAALALPAGLSRRAFAIVSALALALALRTALDAHARRTVPPPGAQLVALVRAQPDADGIAVFGTSSVRFFELTELAPRAFTAGTLGDVQLRLSRIESLPSRVWLTSEVQTRGETRWPLVPVATLCRPPRLDRRMPCLDVQEWQAPFLRRVKVDGP
ncbi:MAG TPA: glycosyltransferase family 39 protein [Polyangiaceae bacterium]